MKQSPHLSNDHNNTNDDHAAAYGAYVTVGHINHNNDNNNNNNESNKSNHDDDTTDTTGYGTYMSVGGNDNANHGDGAARGAQALNTLNAVIEFGNVAVKEWEASELLKWVSQRSQEPLHESKSNLTHQPHVVAPAELSTLWNAQFQSLFDDPAATPIDRQYRTERLNNLIASFKSHALKIAQVIVAEMHLKPARKQVRPMNVGGIMGGEKYIHSNILFKFASLSEKTQDMFQHDEQLAQKSAANEIRAMNNIIDTNVAHLHITLTAMFYIHGRCVIATALAPLKGQETLAYGSCDAAKHIAKKEGIAGVIHKLAEKLRLKPHNVIEGATGNLVVLETGADVEGQGVCSFMFPSPFCAFFYVHVVELGSSPTIPIHPLS